MLRFAALILAFASIASFACGSSSPGTGDLQEALPTIPAQPADLTAVVPEGAWDVASEGNVSDPSFGGASLVVPGGPQAIDGYERELQAGTSPATEPPYPTVAYSSVLLFESPEEARAYFDAAAPVAREADWLASNPELDGSTPEKPQVEELPIAISESVDGILWLHSSAIGEETTYTDDVFLVLDGRMVAFARAPGSFAGTDSRAASTSVFETALILPIASRMHDALD